MAGLISDVRVNIKPNLNYFIIVFKIKGDLDLDRVLHFNISFQTGKLITNVTLCIFLGNVKLHVVDLAP